MNDDDADYQQALQRNREWVSDNELAALGLERATGIRTEDGKPESPVDQANRMMREGAPMAASALLKLVRNGESETVRLRAAVEVLNRAQAAGSSADGRDPWDSVYDKVMVGVPSPEAEARIAQQELEAKGIKPASIDDKDLPRH